MLLARLAESTFWFGRYLERAEDLARAILAFEESSLDMPARESPAWQGLAALAGVAPSQAADRTPAALVGAMLLDRQNPSSLLGTVNMARENLRRCRSLLPPDCWQTLNPLYLRLAALGPEMPLAALGPLLGQVVAVSHELAGQIANAMIRDESYAFLRIGAHLERADMLLRTVTVVSDALIPVEHQFGYADVRWMGLLKSVGAYETYRRRYHARADFGSALELLFFDSTYPRSLEHSLLQVGRELAGLPRGEPLTPTLRACWPSQGASTRVDLARLADRALEALAAFSAAFEAHYFLPAPDAPGPRPRPERVDRAAPGAGEPRKSAASTVAQT